MNKMPPEVTPEQKAALRRFLKNCKAVTNEGTRLRDEELLRKLKRQDK